MTLCLALLLAATGTLGGSPGTHSAVSILHVSLLATNQVAATQPPSRQGIQRSDKPKDHAKQPRNENPPQTFTGIVEWEYKPLAWDCDVPNCDHFALYDDISRTNYELDDARKALPFEGKRVKVTGVLDTKNNLVHLLSIEPATK